MNPSRELKALSFEDIGRRISSQRRALGLSRMELAEAIGVTAKFISDIEYGDKGMSIQTFYKLVQVLGVSSDFLFNGKPEDTDDEHIKRIKENILAPLSSCEECELKFIEVITRQYIQVLRSRNK